MPPTPEVTNDRERILLLEHCLREVTERLEKMEEEHRALYTKLNKYEGRLGGILIAAAAIIAALKFIVIEGRDLLTRIMGG